MVNILYSYSTPLGSKVAILEDMIVDTKYRGDSIGSSLLDYVVQNLKENGIKE